MNEKDLKNILKADAENEPKKHRLSFARKFVTAITALSLSTLVALGTTACASKGQEPESPVNPNPPVVTPGDQENQTPDNQDQENPDDSTSDNPTPENPDDTTPENSDDPTPENPNDPTPESPEEPEIDYDNLTAADLTDEQKAKIVENVTTALETNIQRTIGNSGVVNKVVAIDFEDNYVKLLLDYTNNSLGNMYGFFKYEMSTDMTFKKLLTTNVAPKVSNAYGTEIIQPFSPSSHDDRGEGVYNKLATNSESLDFVCLTITAGPVISIGGTHSIIVHAINQNRIAKVSTLARSDGDRTDPIGQSILNGVCEIYYTIPQYEEFVFSAHVLYDSNGLVNTASIVQ